MYSDCWDSNQINRTGSGPKAWYSQCEIYCIGKVKHGHNFAILKQMNLRVLKIIFKNILN